MSVSKDDENSKKEVLFLNLTVRDGSEAVKAKVAKRLARLPVPVKNQAANRASHLTSPRMITQQLSQKLLKKLPKKMKEKGITVEMEEIFREGIYVVLQLKVIHVDPVVLTNNKKKATDNERGTLSGFVRWFVEAMGEGFQKAIEEEYLPRQVANHLAVEMPKILADKMASEKVVAEIKVLTKPDAQSAFCTEKLKEIRKLESIWQSQLRKVRRSISSLSNSSGGNSVHSVDDSVTAKNTDDES